MIEANGIEMQIVNHLYRLYGEGLKASGLAMLPSFLAIKINPAKRTLEEKVLIRQLLPPGLIAMADWNNPDHRFKSYCVAYMEYLKMRPDARAFVFVSLADKTIINFPKAKELGLGLQAGELDMDHMRKVAEQHPDLLETQTVVTLFMEWEDRRSMFSATVNMEPPPSEKPSGVNAPEELPIEMIEGMIVDCLDKTKEAFERHLSAKPKEGGRIIV